MATSQKAGRAELTALLADEYLSDLIYNALLERGEAAKASEITLEIDNPRIAFPIVRRALADSPRFISVDRQWNLAARYLDKSRPTERNLVEVLNAAGRPLSTAQLATELSEVYGRPSDVYLTMLAKTLANRTRYFKTRSNEFGPVAWLPLVDADDADDVLFDNDLTAAQVEPYQAAKADWSAGYAAATRAIVAAQDGKNGEPVSHRIIGVLAWMALEAKYDPAAHLTACLADPELVWLSSPGGGRWMLRSRADALEIDLEERAASMVGEEPEEPVTVAAAAPVVATTSAAAVDGTDDSAAEEEAAAEPVTPPVPPRKPLDVTEADKKAIEQIVVERGAAVDVVDLLALQYEVVPGDPSFREDLQVLNDVLRADDRFQYVGAGRFREPNSLPLFVYTIPESLHFPDLQFVSMEGEIMDEEIEDEGFVGSLRSDVLYPLAQDAGDDEGHFTGPVDSENPDSVRLVVKAHHKEIGTFPLCQVPDGFFPGDAPVIEILVRDPSGQTHDVIVNNEIRMAFNLFGLYEYVAPDSGGVFFLQRTARPYEYRFVPDEATDPQVYLTPARLSELTALREQADETGSEMATFDIVCEVLAHYPKGLDFVQAMTEVNIVRRVTRRKLASILSNYYCFAQKQGQPAWRFDAKKRDLGTDRAKRKYLKR